MEGLLFGGGYLRREICVSKSIGLASQMEGNLPFLLCFTLYFRANSKYKPPREGLYLEGRFNGGVFALPVWGWGGGELYLEALIHGGAYFRNFVVPSITYPTLINYFQHNQCSIFKFDCLIREMLRTHPQLVLR